MLAKAVDHFPAVKVVQPWIALPLGVGVNWTQTPVTSDELERALESTVIVTLPEEDCEFDEGEEEVHASPASTKITGLKRPMRIIWKSPLLRTRSAWEPKRRRVAPI